eukprot:TRINITY_DN2475_c0_g1_i1.p1 TRINITY_DN2475_c0_g1~~TRINITY_DN2475_c0_g1_i1.p1  ORF type:complete len:111 (+),score=9.77 TRINITY_DN2475_c0_g1_i1:158-490(+)
MGRILPYCQVDCKQQRLTSSSRYWKRIVKLEKGDPLMRSLPGGPRIGSFKFAPSDRGMIELIIWWALKDFDPLLNILEMCELLEEFGYDVKREYVRQIFVSWKVIICRIF